MNAREVTRALGGDWSGGYGLAPSPGHSPKDRGLKIWDAPELPGGVGVHSFNGHTFQEVRDALRAQGLLSDGGDWTPPDLVELERLRHEREAQERARIERRVAAARRYWREAVPIAGTLAERYLREGRGLTRASLPPTLRFHPALPLRLLGGSGVGRTCPAMVAGVAHWPSREVKAVHVTYLAENGLGKADMATPKKMLAPAKGGAVRLRPVGDTLAVGEGIESALGFSILSGLPVWAALSTVGLRSLQFPENIKRLVIATDPDDAGLKAANELACRALASGLHVDLSPPPSGRGDWADLAAARTYGR